MCHDVGPVGGAVSVASGACGCGVWSLGVVAGGLWMLLGIAVGFIHRSCEPQWCLRFVGCGVSGLRFACVGRCRGGLTGVCQWVLYCDRL